MIELDALLEWRRLTTMTIEACETRLAGEIADPRAHSKISEILADLRKQLQKIDGLIAEVEGVSPD